MNVAIVGRPNVGKSALFNRLVGRSIAIVHDEPGITRDRISAVCKRGDRPFTVWDTGGIVGAGESQLHDDVRRAVDDAIKRSDVLLFVTDGKTGRSPMDEELARLLRRARKPVVLVVNKIDTDKKETLAVEFDSLGFEPTISISAAHGRGIGELVELIEQLRPSRKTGAEVEATVAAPSPLALAVVGRPNVGKSSLINAVLRDKRAIVSEIAGTTRDAVDISYERGSERFTFIDTAGIRRRGAHSSSVEVFSVMRAERSIRRADFCVLIVDLTSGVTAQDKRIAGLIQRATKAAVVVLNKWDLVKPKRGPREAIREMVETARAELFFLDYAPMLVASALTQENVVRIFRLIDEVERASHQRIGTGVLNRLLRAAFAANPPPMVSGKRLKLFYAAQAGGKSDPNATASEKPRRPQLIEPPEFVLFVNDPRVLNDPYRRYLEARLREAQPYPGLPILLTLRPRGKSL